MEVDFFLMMMIIHLLSFDSYLLVSLITVSFSARRVVAIWTVQILGLSIESSWRDSNWPNCPVYKDNDLIGANHDTQIAHTASFAVAILVVGSVAQEDDVGRLLPPSTNPLQRPTIPPAISVQQMLVVHGNSHIHFEKLHIIELSQVKAMYSIAMALILLLHKMAAVADVHGFLSHPLSFECFVVLLRRRCCCRRIKPEDATRYQRV